MNENLQHKPVLLEKSIDLLGIKKSGLYIDATFGGGGHTKEILNRLGEAGKVVAFDRDPSAIKKGQEKFKKNKRLTLVCQRFGNLKKELEKLGIEKVDGIIADLGISSIQLDDPERGFSYKHEDGDLDMRMGGDQDLSASEYLAKASPKDLIKLLIQKGEIVPKAARAITKSLIQSREINKKINPGGLKSIIKKSVPERYFLKNTINVFRALRMEVNAELSELREFLPQAVQLLDSKGVLAVISFHSLEDRIVKRFIREESRDCICDPKQPICTCDHRARLKILTKKPVRPDEAEIADNPRARSALLRAAKKV